MSLRDHYFNLIRLLDNPLSVLELAELGCLPSALHISNIAMLMYPDSPGSQQALEIAIKKSIRDGSLNVLTVGEWSRSAMEEKQASSPEDYKELSPPCQLPNLDGFGLFYSETDIIPEDNILSENHKRMFVIHKDDMKNWLEGEEEWPLHPDNKLMKWWPEFSSLGVKENFSPKLNGIENYFKLEIDFLEIRFKGEIYKFSTRYNGIWYIVILIERAYSDQSEISPIDLYFELKKRDPGQKSEYSDYSREQLDKKGMDIKYTQDGLRMSTQETINNYKSKIYKLNDEIEDAIEIGNNDKALKLRAEKEAIADGLSKVLGLSGRIRTVGSDGEKARKNVQRSIRRALDYMAEKKANELSSYLNAHITTGDKCCFKKDPETSWKIIR